MAKDITDLHNHGYWTGVDYLAIYNAFGWTVADATDTGVYTLSRPPGQHL